MANFEEKKYLDLAGLQSYHAKLVAKIDGADKVLDEAVKKVAGDLNAEKTNRENADKAINEKIGTVPEGKTVAQMIADAQSEATYDDTDVKKGIEDNKKAIDAINNETTGILAQAKAYADGKDKAISDAQKAADKAQGEVDDLELVVENNAKAAKVTLAAAETATEGYLKTYVISQGTAEVGRIDIPKELVVTGGEVVVNPDGQPEGTYIKLSIANQESPIYINVKDLVDVYTAEKDAAQVQLTVSDTNEISAVIVAGSIGTAELANAAVTTAKIADASVTRAKLDASLEADIKALEDAVGEGGSVDTQITNAINKLDADVSSAAPEAGKGVQVQVVEVDGKITTVNVTGNYDNAYDALGAAATAKTEAINAAALDATTKANQALEDAKDYTDELNASFVKITEAEISALFVAQN